MKRDGVKKMLTIALAGAMLLLCSCGASPESKIVGQWVSDGGKVFYNEIEFFDNGSYITQHVSWSGNYDISGNRIALNGKVYSEALSFEFEDDDTLILINELGTEQIYKKVK